MCVRYSKPGGHPTMPCGMGIHCAAGAPAGWPGAPGWIPIWTTMKKKPAMLANVVKGDSSEWYGQAYV